MERTRVYVVEDQPQLLKNLVKVLGTFEELEVVGTSQDGEEAVEDILILTSYEDEQKVYEAIQAGASGYLVKRVGPEKIRSGIREVMEGGTVLEPLIARRFWNYFHSIQA